MNLLCKMNTQEANKNHCSLTFSFNTAICKKNKLYVFQLDFNSFHQYFKAGYAENILT